MTAIGRWLAAVVAVLVGVRAALLWRDIDNARNEIRAFQILQRARRS